MFSYNEYEFHHVLACLRAYVANDEKYLNKEEIAKTILEQYDRQINLDWQAKEELAIKQISGVLNDFVNGSSRSNFQKLAEDICRYWHPTLQQALFGFMTMCIKLWADKEWVDGRLEYTKEQCQKIMNGPLAESGTGAPLI
jgi:hypothetical protein